MKYSIPISQMRKKFGEIEAMLPFVDFITITKKGKPLANLVAAPEIKKSIINKFAGSLKKTDLDSDKAWNKSLRKKSRKKIIKI
ncbi:MAG: hypothetical protein ACPLRN_00675 [Microgenomates group bacterium]